MDAPADYAYRTSYDIAKRFRDQVWIHQLALTKDEIIAGRYIAVRLSDGSTDGHVYDTRTDACRHQRRAISQHLYFKIPLEPFGAQVADLCLWYARCAYDNGWREDPAADPKTLILPTRMEAM